MIFADRVDAGRRLAEKLVHLQGTDVVVLGLPRGGVPVAFEVAKSLNAPLDVIVVRKLGVPFQPELGMGAIAEGGVRVVNRRVLRTAGIDGPELAAVAAAEQRNLARRVGLLRGGRPAPPLEGRTAVVVDDGMATGITALAACRSAKARGAEHVILAVPVASPEAISALGREVEVVSLQAPHNLYAVGQWYADFNPISDAEVLELLDESGRTGRDLEPGVEVAADPVEESRTEVEVDTGPVRLRGELVLPRHPIGIVMFAHGSGSGRHSPRNLFVAERLQQAGLATFLFDLLSPAEEANRGNVFDINLLAGRLVDATGWVRNHSATAHLPIGYFGASTGAAAALWAASQRNSAVAALVSRGGRPDLAGPRLDLVRCPTLLIVGSLDAAVVDLNRQAQSRLRCENRLAVVPGATHLFEEPGALAAVSDLAATWFLDHMPMTQRPAA